MFHPMRRCRKFRIKFDSRKEPNNSFHKLIHEDYMGSVSTQVDERTSRAMLNLHWPIVNEIYGLARNKEENQNG